MDNNFNRILKNSIIYGFGNVSSRIIGFILIPIYTKHLLVSEYGIIGILEITSQILLTVFGMSIENGLMRWYWDKDYISKQKSIVFTVASIVTFFALCMNLFFQPLAKQMAVILLDDPTHERLIQMMVISASLQMIIQLPITLMRLQEKSILFSSVSIIRFVITLLLTILFVVYLERSILGIYEALIIGQIIVIVICAFYLSNNIKIKFETDIIKTMVSYSLPLALASISGVLLSVSDRYLIKFILGIHDVGIYALGFKTANTIKVFLILSIQLALSPVNFKMMSDPNHKKFYSSVMIYFTYLVILAALFFSLYSREIIKLISLNPAYWQAYQVIPLISFAYIFTVLKDTSAMGLHIVKNTRPFAYILIIILFLNLLLNMILLPIMNITGAALANLISQFLFFILVYLRAQKSYYITYKLKKIMIMVLTAALIVIIGMQIDFSSLWINLFLKLMLIILFPLAMVVLRVHSMKDLAFIREAFKEIGRRINRKSTEK